MNILNIDYTIERKSIDIYVAGCKGNNGVHCKNCHNQKSWNFNEGKSFSKYLDYLEYKINNNNLLIDNIMIFGGEPLDQDLNHLKDLLQFLNKFNKNIWLFTRYETLNLVDKNILSLLQYIKLGSYKEELTVNDNIQHDIQLATSNQKILKLQNIFK